MKAFWAALAAFLLLWGLACWNCAAVCRDCEELLMLEKALPEEGKDAAPAAAALREGWEARQDFLALTVRRDQLLTAESALVALENLRESDENADYLAARGAFRAAVEAILRTEKPSLQSVF